MKTSKPRKLRAIQTSRSASQRMHVSHHRHTGRVLPRRHTSYPTLAMIVLITGVFLAGWTHFASSLTITKSGTYTVHASVPGPPPTQAATIDSPLDGATFKSTPITVSGSCPINTYEVLYRNGAFSGVALCDAVGHYQLQTDLFAGANQLRVRDFSQTDQGGPYSNLVNVTYNPSVPPVVPGTTEHNNPVSARSTTDTSGPGVIGQPLIFKTDFKYEGHYVGATSSWQMDIEGGSAPYAVSVDWGDGTHSLISRPRAGTFTLTHTYKKAGGYKGSYVAKFTASDSSGEQTFLQLIAIVNNPPNNSVGSTGPSLFGGNSSGTIKKALKYAWPSYGIVVLMLASFWLGERREYQQLKRTR